MQYLGIDWSYRRAAWCALSEGGGLVGEGAVPADEDGLARLVLELGLDVRAVVEMMSGAVWVRDTLTAAGWRVQVAHARKVRDVAALACKTDKVDARVLAELCRRDLVPELWVPSLADRELRERLRRRMHLVRMRGSAMNRIFGLLTQWGLRLSLRRLREPDAMELLEQRGVPRSGAARSARRSRSSICSTHGSPRSIRNSRRWRGPTAASCGWTPSPVSAPRRSATSPASPRRAS